MAQDSIQETPLCGRGAEPVLQNGDATQACQEESVSGKNEAGAAFLSLLMDRRGDGVGGSRDAAWKETQSGGK